MTLKLIKIELGPWPMNAYGLICEETRVSALIDPGADAQKALSFLQETSIEKILITHGHADHVGALQEVKAASGAPVYLHPADATKFDLPYDTALTDGEVIKIGQHAVRAIHVRGHTPGLVCFDLGDGRIIVGDALFVGGPGKTWAVEDFATTMENMQKIIFAWPDETEFFPGHGPSGTIGVERSAYEAFAARSWPADLFGDVTWK
jgi:hydroxyacylglutathione hydrolase